ncbi:IS3 family transposase [Alcaligenes phenolicus]|uniref:IS3 family transposase n=1 Tax=Alcaligenes phenolicus TaxID=232846 RepID=UPI0038B3D5E9
MTLRIDGPSLTSHRCPHRGDKLKSELFYLHCFLSIEQLGNSIRQYIHYYNHHCITLYARLMRSRLGSYLHLSGLGMPDRIAQKSPQLRGLSGFLRHQEPSRARRGIIPTQSSLAACC